MKYTAMKLKRNICNNIVERQTNSHIENRNIKEYFDEIVSKLRITK